MPGPTTVRDPELAAVIDWFTADGRELPWRPSRNVYEIWVSEVMSAQTTVGRAAEFWERWIARWPTVQALAGASLGEVLAQWQGLGYPRRARDLHRSARIVAVGGWPDDLTELPGVGPYVAAAVRCFALEEPVLPRDVNVNRVLRRRFPDGVDIRDDPWRAGQALMELGQRICTARPRCERCPTRAGCPGSESDVAAPKPRRQARFEGSLRQRRGLLLRRVLDEGPLPHAEADAQAADSLLSDGLLILANGLLRAPD